MKRPLTADTFYVVSEIRWQQNLCHISPDYFGATCQVLPGFFVALPRWCSPQDRARWLAKADARQVSESELNTEIRERINHHDLM
jgi:hypothetical protein